MKLIRPSYEVLPTFMTTILLDIEKAARTCYKSEKRITENSAVKLYKDLVVKKHKAMLEFGANLVFKLVEENDILFLQTIKSFLIGEEKIDDDVFASNYLNISSSPSRTLVSASLRVFRDVVTHFPYSPTSDKIKTSLTRLNPLFVFGLEEVNTDELESLELITEFESDEERLIHDTLTVKFICDRGVSHEIVRHRPCSFAQESTRFCNYGKTGEIQIIIPCWINDEQIHLVQTMNEHNFNLIDEPIKAWYGSMVESSSTYNFLVKLGWQPQQARSVLPNSLKTEINVKATLLEWRHIFNQRVAQAAHPQMRELMIPLQKALKSLK